MYKLFNIFIAFLITLSLRAVEYILSTTVNGQSLSSNFFTHSMLVRGSLIKFKMK